MIILSDKTLTLLSITLISIGTLITYHSIFNLLYPTIDLYHRGNLNPYFDIDCINANQLLRNDEQTRILSTTTQKRSATSSSSSISSVSLDNCYKGIRPIEVDMVLSHHHEDINWINTYFSNTIYPNYRKIILSRDNYDNHIFNIQPNIGYEFYSYIWYIVHFYNTLPPYILFLHSHEESWHIYNQHLPTIIQNLNYSRAKFININFNRYFDIKNGTYTIPSSSIITTPTESTTTTSSSTNEYDDISKIPWEIRHYRNIYKVWYALHLDRYFGSIPDSFGVHCCGQYMVHSSLIHRLPLSVWKRIYEWLKNEQYLSNPINLNPREIGFIFEYLFPYLIHGQENEQRVRNPCHEGYLKNCHKLPAKYQDEITPCCTDKFLSKER